MTAHEMLTDWDNDDRVVRAACSCGGWSGERPLTGRANTLTKAHALHRADANDRERAAERRAAVTRAEAWAKRSGHCYGCGQPAEWCLCPTPCDCAAVHRSGSGIGRDPAAVFSAPGAADVPMFDVDGAS